MSVQDVVKEFKEKFKGKILGWEEKSPKRYYITISEKDLLEIVEFVFAKQKARFIIESGIDTPHGIEMLYHFSFDKLNKIITFRILLPKKKCEVESIGILIPGANWIEREITELLGVGFLHHPDPGRLLLADDWPSGAYPLRQEVKSKK
jgi:Ni,Fe-hydrogenase III component G